ncbi:MAG: hypothetical protein WCD80_00270 [Desulfobaccales bacterium]
MTGNLVIMLFSILIITLALSRCVIRLSKITVIDLYILFVGFHFGVYPLIRGWLGAYSDVSPLTSALVFLHVILTFAILLIITSILPETYQNGLEITYLCKQWSKINKYFIFFLLSFIFGVEIIGWWHYGIISNVNYEELSRIRNPLPYWLSSIYPVLPDLIFCAFLVMAAKVIASTGQNRKWWFVLVAMLFIDGFLFGRRALVNMAVIGAILFIVVHNKAVWRWSYVKWMLVIGLSLFIFSNLFQNYRGMMEFDHENIMQNQIKLLQLFRAYRGMHQLPVLEPSYQGELPSSGALDGHLDHLRVNLVSWELTYFLPQGRWEDLKGKAQSDTLRQWLNNFFLWREKQQVSLHEQTLMRYRLQGGDHNKTNKLFQTYSTMLQYPTFAFPYLWKSPISAALDARATIDNLKIRLAPWEFNLFILKGHLAGLDKTEGYGDIMWQGLKNSIPRVLWPGKKVVSLNDITATKYGVRVIDYPKNNYGFLLADFGFLSCILLPLMLLMVFVTMAIIILFTQEHPILLCLSSGFLLNYLINIEQNIADIYILYRNLLLIFLCYLICYLVGKLFARSRYPITTLSSSHPRTEG